MRKHTSLASVAPGEAVTVRQILFDSLRAYCASRGLHEGDGITLLEGGPPNVLILATGGTPMRCPTEFARFVEVSRNQRP
jgi:hypothetical protein